MPASSRDFSRRNFGRGFSRDAKSEIIGTLKSAATSVLSQRRYFLTNDAVVPRQCRPRGSSTDSRRTTVNGLFASRLTVTSCLTVARFDRTMPAFVIPRRGSRGRQCLVSVSSSDATHPGEMTDPGEAWPLPKRLRVRLQTSAERFGKDTDLDERLRLAERLQVRSSTAERASRAFRGFVFSPCERRFTCVACGRGGGFRKREARARTTTAWQSSRRFGGETRPCASRVADTLPRTRRRSRGGPSETRTHRCFRPEGRNRRNPLASVSSIFVFFINAFPDSFLTPRLFHLFHLFPRTNVDRPLPKHKRITKN